MLQCFGCAIFFFSFFPLFFTKTQHQRIKSVNGALCARAPHQGRTPLLSRYFWAFSKEYIWDAKGAISGIFP
jgi:hypothetical protein